MSRLRIERRRLSPPGPNGRIRRDPRAERLGLGRGAAAPLSPRVAPDALPECRSLSRAPTLDAKPAHSAASTSSATSATAGRGPTTPSSIAAQLGQATATVSAPVARA